MTQSGFTLQKLAIFLNMLSSVIGSSQRRTIMLGEIPAACRYKRIGLSVGDDYKSPFTCEFLRGGAQTIVCTTGKPPAKEDYGLMLAYKTLFPLPVLFVFSDCIYLVNKRINEQKANEIFNIDYSLSVPNLKNGRDTVVVIDR